eukprot:scaffold93426_cov42-Phaeocystis_antarctica.AAC.1
MRSGQPPAPELSGGLRFALQVEAAMTPDHSGEAAKPTRRQASVGSTSYRVISYLRRTFLGLRRGFAQIELSQIYL